VSERERESWWERRDNLRKIRLLDWNYKEQIEREEKKHTIPSNTLTCRR